MKGSIMLAVFKCATKLRMQEKTERDLTDAQMVNFLQIDVERCVETIKAFVDLWIIPLQVIVAFALLYMQVNVGFLAGVAMIVIMIPINSVIAQRIAKATGELMKHKDSRIAILAEALKGMLALKCGNLEEEVMEVSGVLREKEVSCLRMRKYLDAWCVLLWATMPLAVPNATFMATLLILKENLSPAKILTTLALLNMLIFPMNAFPWVVNNIMEGGVSAARVMKIIYNVHNGCFFGNDIQYGHNNNSSNDAGGNQSNNSISDSKGETVNNLSFTDAVIKWPKNSLYEKKDDDGMSVNRKEGQRDKERTGFFMGPFNFSVDTTSSSVIIVGPVGSGKHIY